jgi:hypothetical protein
LLLVQFDRMGSHQYEPLQTHVNGMNLCKGV